MEEKDTGYESGYSFVMTLLSELRQQYARQVKIMYVMIFVILVVALGCPCFSNAAKLEKQFIEMYENTIMNFNEIQ